MTGNASARADEAKPRRRWRRWLLVPLVLLLVVLAFVAWQREFLFLRLGCVEEGVLYRSAGLDEDALEDVARRHGLRTIVDLRRTQHAPSVEVARRLDLRYVWLPTWQTPKPEVVERFLATVDETAHRPVLVHCEHGIGRTGVLCAIYRMDRQGWSLEDAVAEAQRYALWGSFWDDEEKRRYLERYVERKETGGR